VRKLNGWQRLWVVVCVVWALVVTGFLLTGLKVRADVDRWHEEITADYESKIVELQNPVKNKGERTHSFLYELNTRDFRTIDEVKSARRHVEADYIDQLENLHWFQAKQIGAAFAWWVFSGALVYGLGLTLNWVCQGFRPKPAR
jgi:hypothetical protein